MIESDLQLVQDYLDRQRTSTIGLAVAQDEISKNAGSNQTLATEIRCQFDLLEARFQKASAGLELAMLNEIYGRLEIAAAKTAANFRAASVHAPDQFGGSLAKGQQAEMENYRRKIRMMEMEIQLAESRIDVVELQKNSAPLYARLTERPSSGFAWVFPAPQDSLISMLSVSHTKTLSPQPGNTLSALPSKLLDRSFGLFPSHFVGHGFNRRPIQLSHFHLTQNYRSPVSLSLSRSSLGFSSRSLKKRSSFNRHGLSSFRFGSSVGRSSSYYRGLSTFGRAYQYGVIRPDLRPFLRVGQVPWYFPGSASNLRLQQLRTKQRSSFGVSGSQLLRTTIFTDVYGR